MRLGWCLTFASLVGLPLCAADSCNPRDLQGSYGYLLSGETSISGKPQPATSLGRIVLDDSGGISGYSSVMIAGFLLGNSVTGTFESHRDCTASWSLQDDSGGFQHFSGVVSSQGERVEFRQTDPGGAPHGIMLRTADACSAPDLQRAYALTISGSYTPMAAGDAPASVSAKGVMWADPNGNFRLTLRGSSQSTPVTLSLDPDCTVHLQLDLPAEPTGPATLRGILVDGAKQILAIQTDPGWMVSAQFTAQETPIIQ